MINVRERAQPYYKSRHICKVRPCIYLNSVFTSQRTKSLWGRTFTAIHRKVVWLIAWFNGGKEKEPNKPLTSVLLNVTHLTYVVISSAKLATTVLEFCRLLPGHCYAVARVVSLHFWRNCEWCLAVQCWHNAKVLWVVARVQPGCCYSVASHF